MKNYGYNTEHGRLTSVMLYKPGVEINNYPDSAKIEHLRPINHEALSAEFDNIIKTFENFGAKVLQIDPSPLSNDKWYRYNMMYCRDLLFMTPEGAVISNMANSIRKDEVLYAERTLKANHVPVLHKISGNGKFEGADALWLNKKLVVVGVGNRTNREAYEQIKQLLAKMNVKCIALPSYQTKTQHLLGTLQIVDRKLALLRHEITDKAVSRFLTEQHFIVINIPENNEVRTKQAMNIVTLSARNIMMAAGCPETKAIIENAGITVAVELDLTQLINGAGGLACAAGIIAREF